jgi:hypothetical protein
MTHTEALNRNRKKPFSYLTALISLRRSSVLRARRMCLTALDILLSLSSAEASLSSAEASLSSAEASLSSAEASLSSAEASLALFPSGQPEVEVAIEAWIKDVSPGGAGDQEAGG